MLFRPRFDGLDFAVPFFWLHQSCLCLLWVVARFAAVLLLPPRWFAVVLKVISEVCLILQANGRVQALHLLLFWILFVVCLRKWCGPY